MRLANYRVFPANYNAVIKEVPYKKEVDSVETGRTIVYHFCH